MMRNSATAHIAVTDLDADRAYAALRCRQTGTGDRDRDSDTDRPRRLHGDVIRRADAEPRSNGTSTMSVTPR
jgi:hypothetical protein